MIYIEEKYIFEGLKKQLARKVGTIHYSNKKFLVDCAIIIPLQKHFLMSEAIGKMKKKEFIDLVSKDKKTCTKF